MISYEQFHQIKALQERGLSAGQIARDMSISEKTARLWMVRERYEPSRPKSTPQSKLDTYKDHIAKLLRQFDGYSAVQIFQKLQEDGYEGGYTLVKEYVRKIRPKKSRVFDELVFAPGEAAQVDFGECGLTEVGNTRRKLYVFVMVLCHSRLMYIEFILRQNLEHFLVCHRNAFEAFGGVPTAVIVDRTKCAILGNDRFGKPIPNPRYDDFRKHYGFDIRACAQYAPYQKGRVENGVKYVKINFMNGRSIEPFEVVRQAAAQWLVQIANRRIHRITNRRPIEFYEEIEMRGMQALTLLPYDCSVVQDKLVDKMARFSFEGNRYSVPPQYAPGKITLHILPDTLTMYCDGNLIARHTRCYEKRISSIVDPEHTVEFKQQRRRSEDRKLVQRFLALGHVAVTYYEGLQQRCTNTLSHLRKILALAQYHDRNSVLQALEDAATHNAFSAEYIANLLQFRKNTEAPSPLHVPGKQDLLDLELPEPDLDIYESRLPPDDCDGEDDNNPQNKEQ
jgi:transposase